MPSALMQHKSIYGQGIQKFMGYNNSSPRGLLQLLELWPMASNGAILQGLLLALAQGSVQLQQKDL